MVNYPCNGRHMKNTVTFTTEKGNIFLYSPFRNQFLLCHPLIRHFFQLEKKGMNLSDHLNQIRLKGKLELKDFGVFKFEEVRYQLSKYHFLQKNDFFTPVKHLNLGGILSPNRIEENMSKLQQIIFETTEECNLSCTYCTYSKFYINPERGKQKMNPEDAHRMLDLILSKRDPLKNKELTVSFYGGEPLKNFGLVSGVISHLHAYPKPKPNFRFTMSSNGLLLSKYMDYLAENHVEVAVSLDGNEQENTFRVLKNNKPSFEIVIKNLEKVKKKYPDYFDKCISFLTVLHSKNSYKSVYSFFIKKFKKTPIVSSIATFNINKEFKSEFISTFLKGKIMKSSDLKTMRRMMFHHPRVKEIADTLEKYSGYVFTTHGQLILLRKRNVSKKNIIPTGTCLPFSLRILLTADGIILPCEHISRIFEIGRLDRDGVRIDYDSIALMYNRYYSKIRPLCEQCYMEDHCLECMFNTKIETESPECDFFTDEAHFTHRLSKNLSLIEKAPPLYLQIIKEAFHDA